MGDSIQERNDCIFNYKGETKCLFGVGFMVRKEWKNNISEIKGISERIAILKMNFNCTQNSSSMDTIEQFYMQLNDALQACKGRDIFVIGDFNCNIGDKQVGEEVVVGPYEFGLRNSRRERLINFLFQNRMTVVNSLFNKRDSRKWTCVFPDGRTKNEIITQKPRKVINYQVISNFNFKTNHRLVRCSIGMSYQKLSRKNVNKLTRQNLNHSTKLDYLKNLDKNLLCLQTISELHGVQTLYNLLITSIIKSINEI